MNFSNKLIWEQEKKGATEIEMVRCINSLDMSLSKLREMVKDREAWRCSPRGCKELDTTERWNNNKSKKEISYYH